MKNDYRWCKDYACRKAWTLIYQDTQNPDRIWSVMGKDGIVTHISTSEIINEEKVYKCKKYITKYEVCDKMEIHNCWENVRIERECGCNSKKCQICNKIIETEL